jgi:transposase
MYLVLDDYATHNHPKVKPWLERHPQFQLHFTPTASSWLNMVEIFFGHLTTKAIRRGVFDSVPELIGAIEDYLAAHNDDPKPFHWTATADQRLVKVRRRRVALNVTTN